MYTIQTADQGQVQLQCNCCFGEDGRRGHACGVDMAIAFLLDHPQSPPRPYAVTAKASPPASPPQEEVLHRSVERPLDCGHACRVDQVREVHREGCTRNRQRASCVIDLGISEVPTVRHVQMWDDSDLEYDECGNIVGYAERSSPDADGSDSSASDRDDLPTETDEGVLKSKSTKSIAHASGSSSAESSGTRRRKRMTVDAELTRARRASLRPRTSHAL